MTKRRLLLALRRFIHLPRGLNFFRYVWNKWRAMWLSMNKSTKVAYPRSIMFEVTNHCNLKCITCPREFPMGDEMSKGSVHLDNLKKVVDEAYPYVDSIGLTGLGETMLYKDLEAAASYVRSKSKGIIQFISINAHLPKSVEIANRMADIIDSIQISIDGVGEVYEQIRIKGDFDFFFNNVKQIAANAQGKRANVSFNVVLCKENYHQMTDLVNLAQEVGIRFINFNAMNLVAAPNRSLEEYQLYTTPEFKQAYQAAKKQADKQGIEMTIFDFESKPGFNKCLYPWDHFYITWDGYLTPCCAKPFPKELHFGNVFEQGLMNCLNSKEYQHFREMWFRNEVPEFCEHCHFIDLPVVDLA